MKKYFLLFMLSCLAILSCSKEELNATLNGSWKMVLVMDNATGAASTKPASINGDVTLTFAATNATAGTFSGHTTINDFEGNFTTGAQDSLSVTYFSMTKVGETSWGNDFIDNFRNAQSYSVEEANKLTIKSPEKTLTFYKE